MNTNTQKGREKPTPRYTLPSRLSNFLGRWGEYDLYFDSDCCIARYGDKPHEYLAGDWETYKEQALSGRVSLENQHRSPTLECFFRAYRNKLIIEVECASNGKGVALPDGIRKGQGAERAR